VAVHSAESITSEWMLYLSTRVRTSDHCAFRPLAELRSKFNVLL
jgi:hypothetical protein